MLARYFDFSFGSNFCFFPAGGSDKVPSLLFPKYTLVLIYLFIFTTFQVGCEISV